MITLTLKNNQKKKFNLKDFSTERKLYSAWFSMNGDIKFENKRFNIKTAEHGFLSYKLLEIIDCVFFESTYADVKVHTF